ncbi:MAG: trehalose-phosphatase [Candidatus Margulisbacteria bacterium]|nr:trehalose-phosphatase [Candidatus Margulisiibacteriota bacterium]
MASLVDFLSSYDNVKAGMKTIYLLDFDGTLAPLARRPELARLSPPRRRILKKLAQRPGTKVAIISGRELGNLKRKVGIPGLTLIGNHGFETEVRGRRRVYPAAQRFIPYIKKISKVLRAALRFKGVLIEDKGLTLSVHYRQVKAAEQKKLNRAFNAAVAPWRRRVKITRGKKVIELRPPHDWDKGKAVNWLLKELKLRDYFPIYIGDDRTDEDAFRVLKERGMTYFVGRGRTAAKRKLKDVGAVYRLLEREYISD